MLLGHYNDVAQGIMASLMEKKNSKKMCDKEDKRVTIIIGKL